MGQDTLMKVSQKIWILKNWYHYLLDQSIILTIYFVRVTVEALDRSNLGVSIEKKVNQQAVFESINPALKSFFRGKTALVEAGIDALLTLITHNKSANSCSQADLFEQICERKNVVKSLFISAKKICEAW